MSLRVEKEFQIYMTFKYIKFKLIIVHFLKYVI